MNCGIFQLHNIDLKLKELNAFCQEEYHLFLQGFPMSLILHPHHHLDNIDYFNKIYLIMLRLY